MRAFFLQYLTAIRASYWFIPSLMFSSAVAAAFLTLWIDAIWGAEWMNELELFRLTDVESARTVLSTIAASMIGVAGVTFSITLVAVSFASSQFGPRLVGNFMRDRGNQITLGTFISTFIYAMMVLRSVAAPTEELAAFVPHISVLLSIAAAIWSVGVLIYFIHHVPASIDIGTITSNVGRALIGGLDEVFPNAGRPGALPAGLDVKDFARGARVLAERTGYVQTVDDYALLAIAQEDDIVIRLQRRPGDFVAEGDVLLHALTPDGGASGENGLRQEGRMRDLFAIGDDRTADQNILFLAEELIEIAGRALSPGINDPFTAMTCIDWLTTAMSGMAERETPCPYRADEDGTVRLVGHSVDFERLCDRIIPRLTPYVARDYMASIHMVHRLAAATATIDDPKRRAHLRGHLEDFAAAAEDGLSLGPSLASFRQATDQARRLLDVPDAKLDLLFDQSWYGGSA